MKKKLISIVLLGSLLFPQVVGFAQDEIQSTEKTHPDTSIVEKENTEEQQNEIGQTIDSSSEKINNDHKETEEQTTLWDIEEENNVKYDKDYETEKEPVKPSDEDKIKELYERGIKENKINPTMYSFEAFMENYELGKDSYNELKDYIGKNQKYDDWYAEIANYGAFPDGEGHAPSEKENSRKKRSQTDNANKFKKDLRKGDIVVVSGTVGHAAIATSNNYILEMTGGGLYDKWPTGTMKNNNHQFSKHNWLWGNSEQGAKPSKNIDKWIQIWRLPDSSMANKCATYADKTFWNSTGGYKKNKNYDYLISTNTRSMNPTYCSKLVFHSFYYGSGDAEVIKPNMINLTFIMPGALPNLFEGKYAPYKVGTY